MKVPKRVLLLPAVLGLIAACGGTNQAAAPPTPEPTMSMPMATAPSSAQAVATSAVAIQNFAFGPAAITVRAGTKVTWTNRDEDVHTVAITGIPVSKVLQSGDSFSHTFDRTGTFTYVCTIHPEMHGMVIVTGG